MKDNPKEENKTNTTDELLNAVKIVQAAIKAREEKYKKIASTEEQDPILIEGETRTGYDCQLMVDPKAGQSLTKCVTAQRIMVYTTSSALYGGTCPRV